MPKNTAAAAATNGEQVAAAAAAQATIEEQGAAAAPAPATKVRILTACAFGQANQIAELTADELKDAVERGEVDPHPDAVAYAEQLAAAQAGE